MSMNDNELERFEAELRSTGAARPPADFMQRLNSEVPALGSERRAQNELAALTARVEAPVKPEVARASEPDVRPSWLPLILRWLAPAAAVLVVGTIIWRANLPGGHRPQRASSPVRADDVRIEHQLVSTFDTAGMPPSAE